MVYKKSLATIRRSLAILMFTKILVPTGKTNNSNYKFINKISEKQKKDVPIKVLPKNDLLTNIRKHSVFHGYFENFISVPMRAILSKILQDRL